MDSSQQAALQNALQQWSLDCQQGVWEDLTRAWQGCRDRFLPDAALLELIQSLTAPPPPEPVPAPRDTDTELGAALDLIAEAGTQGEVLKRLLDAALPFCGRCALYVIKQGIASLYAHRGFEPEQPRLGVPVVPPPELEALIQGQVRVLDTPEAAYQALLAPLSPVRAAAARMLPLHLRRKTVALLLVDSGALDRIDHPAHLRALALGAEARLAHLAVLREEERLGGAEAHPSVLTQRIPDPIAEAPGPALDPTVRSNAERSARVLVGDIELYFPTKVTQGQMQGNLYGAMKEELDRSRASFVERYGAELESHHQIFYKTVVHQLCADDPSRLGVPPWASR